MSKRRNKIQKIKAKRRNKRFEESGGFGNSKYAKKHQQQARGKYSANSPFKMEEI